VLGFQLTKRLQPILVVTLLGIGLDDEETVDSAGRNADAALVTPPPVAEVALEPTWIVGHPPVFVAGCMLGLQPGIFLAVLAEACREDLPVELADIAERGIERRIGRVRINFRY
jgi:hypothetical protein